MLKNALVALALAGSSAALAFPGDVMTRPDRDRPVQVEIGAPERAPERAPSRAPATPEEPEDARGPKPGTMGAFVQDRHAEGLRGRALAEAIHAEQARRGIGHGRTR